MSESGATTIRVMQLIGGARAVILDDVPAEASVDGEVRWVDVRLSADDLRPWKSLVDRLGLDPLAVHDAAYEADLPKVDDFGHQLVIVLHGLGEEQFETYEVDCFVTNSTLVTVHSAGSPSINTLWSTITKRPRLGGSADEIVARLADIMTRRLLSVVDVFDSQTEQLVELALEADRSVIREILGVRAHVALVREVIHPQREACDALRRSTSDLMTDAGRRRFSDVFDVAARAASELDAARSALSEALDIYRGAEAGKATEVSKVLTIYAAVILPLSLIAGFFGMNHRSIPTLESERGWIVVSAIMFVVAALSLGMFVALGWIRRPRPKETGALLGRALIETARAPIDVAGAAFAMSTSPRRGTTARKRRKRKPAVDDG